MLKSGDEKLPMSNVVDLFQGKIKQRGVFMLYCLRVTMGVVVDGNFEIFEFNKCGNGNFI